MLFCDSGLFVLLAEVFSLYATRIPGQSLPMWNAKELLYAIEGCRILIVNDYELNLIVSKTGRNSTRG